MKGIQLPAIETGELSALIGKLQDTYLLCVLLILYGIWKEKQPINYASAGSTFKRGKDYITAKLIDQCGLKGYNIGDAYVSEKHAGFIINKGNAKAEDILKLIEFVKQKVYEKFKVEIELEIEVLGED